MSSFVVFFFKEVNQDAKKNAETVELKVLTMVKTKSLVQSWVLLMKDEPHKIEKPQNVKILVHMMERLQVKRGRETVLGSLMSYRPNVPCNGSQTIQF